MKVQLLKSPWRTSFTELLSQAQKELVIFSPFVNQEGVRMLVRAIRSKAKIRVRFMTSLTERNIKNGVTAPEALVELCSRIRGVEILDVPNLHAKVYLIDNRIAIVTSANLTSGGIRNNREYGIVINDSRTVARITADLSEYESHKKIFNEESLRRISVEAEKIQRRVSQAVNHIQSLKLRRLLKRELPPLPDAEIIDNSLITIEIHQLLKASPLFRREICDRIQKKYPKKCLNSIKDKTGGITWKHRISAALEALYKNGEGEIARDSGGKYRLVS